MLLQLYRGSTDSDVFEDHMSSCSPLAVGILTIMQSLKDILFFKALLTIARW
jgi:hypothetical protein